MAVFVTQNGTGTGVLITFGGILLVLALLGDRIESFAFGGSKLKMRAASRRRSSRLPRLLEIEVTPPRQPDYVQRLVPYWRPLDQLPASIGTYAGGFARG